MMLVIIMTGFPQSGVHEKWERMVDNDSHNSFVISWCQIRFLTLYICII